MIEECNFRGALVCACGDHGFVGLTRAGVAYVDPVDVPTVRGFRWYTQRNGHSIYARTNFRDGAGHRRSMLMHRHLTGSAQKYTDHRDGDGLNNRRDNLRTCTSSENAQNGRAHVRNQTGYKGVFLASGSKPYRAIIEAKGVRHDLGRYKTPVAAAYAYDGAARRLHGSFAKTNADLALLPCTISQSETAAAK